MLYLIVLSEYLLQLSADKRAEYAPMGYNTDRTALAYLKAVVLFN